MLSPFYSSVSCTFGSLLRRIFVQPLCRPSWLRSLDRQTFPQSFHTFLCRFIHQNLVGPWPHEPLRRPFACRVDPHFRTEVLQTRRMIQRVHRSQRKLHVPLRVQRAQRLPHHFAIIVNVHVVVHHHNH